MVAKHQVSLVTTLWTRISWGLGGLDVVNKEHGLSLRVMISLIIETDSECVESQLFHLVDPSWNEERVIFA